MLKEFPVLFELCARVIGVKTHIAETPDIVARRLGKGIEFVLACAHRSIMEIAYSWGFNNPNHFSRCFKRQFGVAPRELRNNLRMWPRVSAATKPA